MYVTPGMNLLDEVVGQICEASAFSSGSKYDCVTVTGLSPPQAPLLSAACLLQITTDAFDLMKVLRTSKRFIIEFVGEHKICIMCSDI